MNKWRISLGIMLLLGIAAVSTTKVNAAVYNGWENYNNKWYYYNSGKMSTGWIKDSDKWY